MPQFQFNGNYRLLGQSIEQQHQWIYFMQILQGHVIYVQRINLTRYRAIKTGHYQKHTFRQHLEWIPHFSHCLITELSLDRRLQNILLPVYIHYPRTERYLNPSIEIAVLYCPKRQMYVCNLFERTGVVLLSILKAPALMQFYIFSVTRS